MERGTLLSETPAMRILENEHRYLASLIGGTRAVESGALHVNC
ncbi:hypothetical protein C812_01662 [Paenibacillus barengoltzii G22]|uniref:Uncharacterized protein n=1 Tax=Paenibacillus barengoltzii G22 TaxID=1235795 RepID=R9LNQ2_9BACL|nr:hypothetical protein C812_01662 [Paenibacillus barengoltzii G22]